MPRRLPPAAHHPLSHAMPSDGVGDQMNTPTPLEAGNQFEAQLLSWKVPPGIVREILEYHSNLTYAPGAMIFWQGAPADIIFWVVKGLVKESCPTPRGNQNRGSTGDCGRPDRRRGSGQRKGPVDPPLRGTSDQQVRGRDDYPPARPRAADVARFRNSARGLRADELGVVGVGSLLRDAVGDVVSASGSS